MIVHLRADPRDGGAQVAAIAARGRLEQRQPVGVQLIVQDDGVVERGLPEAGVLVALPVLRREFGARAVEQCRALIGGDPGRVRALERGDELAEKGRVGQRVGPTRGGALGAFGVGAGEKELAGAALADEGRRTIR